MTSFSEGGGTGRRAGFRSPPDLRNVRRIQRDSFRELHKQSFPRRNRAEKRGPSGLTLGEMCLLLDHLNTTETGRLPTSLGSLVGRKGK
jgi:hypothetical protein